eukprot:UN10169
MFIVQHVFDNNVILVSKMDKDWKPDLFVDPQEFHKIKSVLPSITAEERRFIYSTAIQKFRKKQQEMDNQGSETSSGSGSAIGDAGHRVTLGGTNRERGRSRENSKDNSQNKSSKT